MALYEQPLQLTSHPPRCLLPSLQVPTSEQKINISSTRPIKFDAAAHPWTCCVQAHNIPPVSID